MSRPAKYGQLAKVTRKPGAEVSLPAAGRNTPAARSYRNARRAGLTSEQREMRSPFRAFGLGALIERLVRS